MQLIVKYFLTSLVAFGLVGSNVTYAEIAAAKEPTKITKESNRANKAEDNAPVDINKADAEQLATLKGLGPKKAEAVIAYRKEHGGFKAVEDLAEVKGIGKKGLARIQERNPGRIVLQ